MSKGHRMLFAAALSSPHPYDLRSAGRQGSNLPQAVNLHFPSDNPTSAIKSSSVICRTPLDVMRIDMSSGEHRYAVCVASYGYMGDLMRTSERLRFLGPVRYGLAGAWTLLRGAAYEAKVGSLLLLEISAVIGFALGKLCLDGGCCASHCCVVPMKGPILPAPACCCKQLSVMLRQMTSRQPAHTQSCSSPPCLLMRASWKDEAATMA